MPRLNASEQEHPMKTLFAIGAIAVALTSGTVASMTHAGTTSILSADLQAVLDGATDTIKRRGRGAWWG